MWREGCYHILLWTTACFPTGPIYTVHIYDCPCTDLVVYMHIEFHCWYSLSTYNNSCTGTENWRNSQHVRSRIGLHFHDYGCLWYLLLHAQLLHGQWVDGVVFLPLIVSVDSYPEALAIFHALLQVPTPCFQPLFEVIFSISVFIPSSCSDESDIIAAG